MKDLSDYTIIELEQELSRKQKALETEHLPKILYNAKEHIPGHFNDLIDIVRKHIISRVSNQWDSEDDDVEYIYRVAVESVYSQSIWDEIKPHNRKKKN